MGPTGAEPTADQSVPAGLPPTIGRYQILERLGAGGMGTVYKARDPHLDRTVALKIPRIDTPPQERPRRMERFQREARSAAQVWHPHVCPIYDVGEHDGQPYVVMAYVHGQSMADRLARRGRFEDVGEAVALIGQVLDALGAIHAHGIVHRDLKPSNIMLDTSGRAVLTDFGLARPENEAGNLTSEGVIVGTPAYMAPEQAAGQSERIGPWTDLYSAGVVFFEMLTGRLPFEGPPLAVLGKIVNEPPPPLSRFRPYLDSRLEALLLQALAKEPEGRFPIARQFADALAGLAVSTPSIALPPRAISQEELRQPSPASLAQLPGEYLTYTKIAGLYVLPSFLLVVAAVCLIIGLLGKASHDGQAFGAAFWLAAAGSCPLLFIWGRQWLRQQRLTEKNRKGETWLMHAAESGQVSVVRVLLAWGAEIHDKDKGGQTALMKAAANGQTAVVRLLLAGGAEVNEKDKEGQTALALAKAAGHSEIVGLVEAAGARG
jgi:tRNA A-37 threonylcarbamoyl transferase component Bud32